MLWQMVFPIRCHSITMMSLCNKVTVVLVVNGSGWGFIIRTWVISPSLGASGVLPTKGYGFLAISRAWAADFCMNSAFARTNVNYLVSRRGPSRKKTGYTMVWPSMMVGVYAKFSRSFLAKAVIKEHTWYPDTCVASKPSVAGRRGESTCWRSSSMRAFISLECLPYKSVGKAGVPVLAWYSPHITSTFILHTPAAGM